MRVYIAGPMSGLPDHNYPAFNAAAARLRALGYEVLNPAENPEPPCKSWLGYMRMALAQLVTCDAVALLDGWEESRGARIEFRTATDLGLTAMPIAQLEPRILQPPLGYLPLQEPSHDHTRGFAAMGEMVDLIGVRASDGREEFLGQMPIPARMKARELAREMFGGFNDGDGSEGDMAFSVCEQLLDWMKLDASQAADQGQVDPVDGDILPRVGARVFILHGRDDAAHPCTVIGYYVWPDLAKNKHLSRVFVRLAYEGTTIRQARMLCDCYPSAEAALASRAARGATPVPAAPASQVSQPERWEFVDPGLDSFRAGG